MGVYKGPDLRICREKSKCVRHDANDIASLIVEPNRVSDYALLSTENVFPKRISRDHRTSAGQVLGGERSAERWRYSQKRKEAECGLNLMNFLGRSKSSQ